MIWLARLALTIPVHLLGLAVWALAYTTLLTISLVSWTTYAVIRHNPKTRWKPRKHHHLGATVWY